MIVYVIYDDDASRCSPDIIHSPRIILSALIKKEERKREKRIVCTDSTRNKLFIIPTRIPTIIYP